MKKWFLSVSLIAMLIALGCNKTEERTQPAAARPAAPLPPPANVPPTQVKPAETSAPVDVPKARIYTSQLEKMFSSTDAALRDKIKRAMAAIDAGNYPVAIQSLEEVRVQGRLTPDQEKAVVSVQEQLRGGVTPP